MMTSLLRIVVIIVVVITSHIHERVLDGMCIPVVYLLFSRIVPAPGRAIIYRLAGEDPSYGRVTCSRGTSREINIFKKKRRKRKKKKENPIRLYYTHPRIIHMYIYECVCVFYIRVYRTGRSFRRGIINARVNFESENPIVPAAAAAAVGGQQRWRGASKSWYRTSRPGRPSPRPRQPAYRGTRPAYWTTRKTRRRRRGRNWNATPSLERLSVTPKRFARAPTAAAAAAVTTTTTTITTYYRYYCYSIDTITGGNVR